jgi:hypothetical protein
MKVGDKVLIIDGSYAVRVDKFEEFTAIGLGNNVFVIIRKPSSDHLVCGDGEGEKVHNVFIKDIRSGKVYLHSLAFIKPVPKPRCHCCNQLL